MKQLIFALTFIFAANPPLAGADNPPVARTSSVVEMLQLKHEHQLREQLVKEGRWDEVSKLDEERQRRQRAQTKQTLTRMNAELVRESSSESSAGGDGLSNFCAPQGAQTRFDAIRTKQDSASADADNSNVR